VAPYSARAMRSPLAPAFALVAAAALLTAACGGEAAPGTSAAPGTVANAEYLAFRAQPTACGAEAPETVNSFVFLSRQGYFDGTVSHRVVPGFVFQAGDPTATGTGSPGYTVPDDFPAAGFSYARGVVAMANTGAPGSGGSQFFIALDDISLPPSYTVFGEVVEGLDVLDRIASIPMGPNPPDAVASRPLETVYLERVEIVGG
jgi:cyclophilin family peptidyl-prolyl cis-trans isomerase